MYYIIIIAQRVNSISPALMKYPLYFVYTAQKRQTLINRICRSFFLNVVQSGRKNTLWESREAAM